jgi:hypothetical protein
MFQHFSIRGLCNSCGTAGVVFFCTTKPKLMEMSFFENLNDSFAYDAWFKEIGEAFAAASKQYGVKQEDRCKSE